MGLLTTPHSYSLHLKHIHKTWNTFMNNCVDTVTTSWHAGSPSTGCSVAWNSQPLLCPHYTSPHFPGTIVLLPLKRNGIGHIGFLPVIALGSSIKVTAGYSLFYWVILICILYYFGNAHWTQRVLHLSVLNKKACACSMSGAWADKHFAALIIIHQYPLVVITLRKINKSEGRF